MKKIVNEEKWLLVSCLQKSIRKGYEDLALSYAEKLYETDKNYLLYRLSIIGIEDVGLGNIDDVHNLMSTRIKKDNIEMLGGKEYLMRMVSEFSKSIKDRSACELPMLANMSVDMSSKNKKELESIYLDKDLDVSIRIGAGWEILGANKLKNNYIINKEDNIEHFIDLNKELITDTKVIDIMRDAYHIHREPHFIALGLLKSLYEDEKEISIGNYKTGSVVKKDFKQYFIGNKWLLDGIDWHTKEGKSAIYNFCKEKNLLTTELLRLGVDKDYLPNVVGMLLFRNVGHQVDKRLVYPSAINILKEVEKITLYNAIKTDEVSVKEIYSLFIKTYPLIRDRIEKVFAVPDPKYFPF